jgi:hypothetical protein
MTIADTPAPKEAITAALLVIGDKILSGRTKDQNIGYVAEYLTALGMHLAETFGIGSSVPAADICSAAKTAAASGHVTLATKRTLLLTWAGYRLDRTSFAAGGRGDAYC